MSEQKRWPPPWPAGDTPDSRRCIEEIIECLWRFADVRHEYGDKTAFLEACHNGKHDQDPRLFATVEDLKRRSKHEGHPGFPVGPLECDVTDFRRRWNPEVPSSDPMLSAAALARELGVPDRRRRAFYEWIRRRRHNLNVFDYNTTEVAGRKRFLYRRSVILTIRTRHDIEPRKERICVT